MNLVSKIRVCALGAAMVALTIPAFGQENNKQMPPDPQTQQPSTQPSTTQPSTAPQTESQTPSTATSSSSSAPSAEQTFQGTISQSQNGYILKDSAGVTYQLDDQKKAKDFSGQNVKVTGTLDSSTNTIRVSAISPAS
jgi:cytoskeletal protein RodZ